jgi:hypothetical protein
MGIPIRGLLSVAIAALSVQVLIAEPMKQRERDRLLSHLQMTASWLPDEVSSLSPNQLAFRSAPDKWTIAEVVQHLVIAEPNYWKLLQDGINHPPQALKEKASDADVLWYGIDRTRHDKTPAKQDPKGQQVNISEALAAYGQLHSKMLDYAAKTTDDLRSHAVPEWGVDAYQCLLEISTHEQRHILQIREIKADSTFPKH